MKFTDEQIKEIAASIDFGSIYYANPETGEMEEFREDDFIDDFPEEIDEEMPGWEKEEMEEMKAKLDRIDSWKNFVIVRKPNSDEAFRFMEDFVAEVIPESEQKMYWKALNWKKPFANFRDLINDSEYREDWFRYKEQKMMEYVREELGER